MKRSLRLRHTADIQRVRQHGKTQRNPYVVLLYAQQPQDPATPSYPYTRVGVVAGKRLGSAVIRNKVKRQLRAIMQKVYPSLPKQYDILLIARQPINTASFQQIETAVQTSLQRAGLLENTNE